MTTHLRRFTLRAAWPLAVAIIVASLCVRAQSVVPAHRIISLVPAVTEMLFAIGAGPDVVGVSSFDRFPPEVASRPKVGALVDPDFERILTLRPDLVIAYGSQTDVLARLKQSGIGAFSYRHAGLADITATIRELGERVGRAAKANEVAAGIESTLADVRRRVARAPRPRTMLIFSREAGSLRGIYASAGVGFLHDLLVTAGGTDVFADVSRENLQVSSEILLARAPEVILELRSAEGWTPARIDQERHVWTRLPSLPAVRSNRIYILGDDKLTIAGPRVGEVAKTLAAILHPDVR